MEMVHLFLISMSTFLLFKLRLTPKPKNLPPCPPSLPIIGHLYLFKQPLHKTLVTFSNRYGPILYLRFGSCPVLVVSSPSAAEECFTKNDIIFANRPHLLSGKHMGNNYTTIPFASYNDHWRNLRRITAIEIFSSTRINMFSDIHHDEVRCMIKWLMGYGQRNECRTVEMKLVFFELMLNTMMRMIAGKSYYGEHVAILEEGTRFKEIVTETLLLGGATNVVDFLPMLRCLGKTTIEKRLIRLKQKRDEFLLDLIEAHRKLRDRSSADGEGKKMTLIDILLKLQETEPEYYTDETILGIMLSGGTDTSAGTMEWAMSLLLNNGEVIKKAQAEIDNHVEEGQLLVESDLSKLPYLHCIINETLRMYPAGPMLVPHESSEESVVEGYNIPSGTMLLVNQWAIQNDPELWDEPTQFKPERFHGLKGTRDGFKLMPFGSGRRGCPGEGLAMHVVGLALGTLIQCFDWERVGEELVEMGEGTGVTLPKARPLVAKCKPHSNMMNLISQL